MRIHRIVAISLTTLAGLGVGASTVAAGDAVELGRSVRDLAAPVEEPPPTVGALVAPTEREQSTTCEGTVNCTILESACGLVGGTYTGWPSRDRGHDHTHGICTWPWE